MKHHRFWKLKEYWTDISGDYHLFGELLVNKTTSIIVIFEDKTEFGVNSDQT